MRASIVLLGASVISSVLLGALVLSRLDRAEATVTVGVGGQLFVGAPSLSGGYVKVSVYTAMATDAYDGDNLHITFDPNQLSFLSADASTSVYTTVGTPSCNSVPVADGVVTTCTLTSGSLKSAGLLRDVAFVPKVLSGCATLHLFTLNAPDFGGPSYGSYTTRQTFEEANSYGSDVSIDLARGISGCGSSSVGGVAEQPNFPATAADSTDRSIHPRPLVPLTGSLVACVLATLGCTWVLKNRLRR
jgi:hypothetical protein